MSNSVLFVKKEKLINYLLIANNNRVQLVTKSVRILLSTGRVCNYENLLAGGFETPYFRVFHPFIYVWATVTIQQYQRPCRTADGRKWSIFPGSWQQFAYCIFPRNDET